jgi:hypothetical protein
VRATLWLLGTEVLCLDFSKPPPANAATAARPEQGLTPEGAPKVHETHLAADTSIGFRSRTPWNHLDGNGP